MNFIQEQLVTTGRNQNYYQVPDVEVKLCSLSRKNQT